MQTAILLETRRPAPAPDSPAAAGVTGLRDQLHELTDKVVEVCVAAPLSDVTAALDAALGDAGGAVLLVDARLVAQISAFRLLSEDPRVSRGLLVRAQSRPSTDACTVRVDRGTVVALDSPVHQRLGSRTVQLGVCRLDEDGAQELRRSLADVDTRDAALAVGLLTAPIETLSSLLVSRSVVLDAVDARGLVAIRTNSDAAAEDAQRLRDSTDEDRRWLDAAVKARDGFFTTFFVSTWSRFLARRCARWGFTPNQVSLASMAAGAGAAACFATGPGWVALVGAVVLYLAFVLDCVDGQLARYTLNFTSFGSWLDSTLDRAKEYVVYVGLAVGAARTGEDVVWLLAALALALQTFRHALDFSFADHRPPPRITPPVPRTAAMAGTDGSPALPGLLAAAAAAEERPAFKWAKRMVVLPIGERFAVIAVTAALGAYRVTFLILLGWGLLATAYTLTGRTLRTRRW